MLYIVLPLYWKEAGLDSIWQVGILLSINRFVRLPINPIVGWLYKRIPLKTGLMIAVVLGGITTLGYSFANGFIFWLVLRGLWGIAWSLFRIGGLTAIVYSDNDNNRGKLIGLYNGVARSGALFGMLLGGILVPIIGLDKISIMFGLITLIGIPLVFISFKEKNDQQFVQDQIVEKSLHVQRHNNYKMLVLVSGFFITLLFQGVFTSTLTSIIAKFYGEKISIIGIIVSATFLSGFIQSIRGAWEPYLGTKIGKWSDGSKGRLPLFIGSLTLVGVLFGIISTPLPLTLWIVITLFVMLGTTSLTILNDALALDSAKGINTVSFVTKYSLIQDIGAALGPMISFVLLLLNNGFAYLYWGGSIILVILAFIWITVYLNEKVNKNEHTNCST